jgi:hypothetical protein
MIGVEVLDLEVVNASRLLKYLEVDVADGKISL